MARRGHQRAGANGRVSWQYPVAYFAIGQAHGTGHLHGPDGQRAGGGRVAGSRCSVSRGNTTAHGTEVG